MDASTSVYEDEEQETIINKNTQVGAKNYETVRDAWGSHNPFLYPETRRDESIVEDFFDKRVHDPYRWLENPVSEETQLFIDEQNSLTESFVERALWRDAIRAKLTEMWDYKKTQCPKQFGSRYFFLENTGLQNQPKLFVKESMEHEPRTLMDPNELSMDGAASISSYGVSPNGDYIAYSLSDSGSDWASIYIKNVASGQNYLEVLNFTKLTNIVWTNDNRGFFYPKFPKPKSGKASGTDYNPNIRQKLYYHRIGTRQDDDVMIVDFPDHPTWTISSNLTLDGRYLLIFAGDVSAERHSFYMDIGRKGAITRDVQMVPLFSEPGLHHYLANDETKFIFLTNADAPNFKVASMNLASILNEELTTIVEENPSAVISWARVVASNKLVICYNEHLDTRLEIRSLDDGELMKTIVFEDNISAWDHYGRRDLSDLFVRVESYLNPGILYRLHFEEGITVESEVYDKIEIPYYDPGNFTTELVFYSNDDGTNVPMALLYKNSTPLDGSAPCILCGNGSLCESVLPEFNVSYLLFAQNFDGVVAIANIRGGGEYGKTWWDEGRLNKQNSIEDFIAAANFLINNKYTRSSRLTIMGASTGATTVAAVMNKRPELFAAAVVDVGVMDLLRFQNFTIGHQLIGEYGDIENNDELQYILNYSPLQNIIAPTNSSPQYPSTLVTTADHDDRVVPFHSYKYIAELQHTVGQTMTQTNPLMLKAYQNIGHKHGLPTIKAIEKATDVFCFLENAVDYEFHF